MVACPPVDTIYFSKLVGAERAGQLLVRERLAQSGEVLPQTIEMIDFWRLCAQNIQLTDDESHGIAAEPVPRGSLSVLFTAAKEADDLGGALRRLTEAARLVRRDCQLTLSRGAGIVRFTVHAAGAAGDDPLRAEIYAECFAIVAHCALRWMAGRRVDPVRVRGAAALQAMGGELLNALHIAVARRGSGVSIDYALADMALPVVVQKYTAWGEAEFASFVAMLEQDSSEREDDALRRVFSEFEGGRLSQRHVATALGVSVATLRRRLSAAGHSFRELSATHRAGRLRNLLATDVPLAEIAEQLGLSDDRSLRRFCAMHLGASPQQLRNGEALRA